MPITIGLLALAAKALFPDLSWAEAFLLAAVLSPTDPVVTSAVVTSRLVPSKVRHTLNLESGLNDGLALPFVLFFLVLASPGGDAGAEALRLIGEAAVGAAIGIALGVFAGRLHFTLPGGGITPRYEGIYSVGFALAAFGLAEVTIGNGLIAAFVCGIALGASEREVPDGFVEFAENSSAILQVLTFFVFGGLIYATGFHHSVPPLVLFVAFALLVARPVAVMLSFMRTGIPQSEKHFMAWFGP
jgi:NhaP-type Na+/H+ or K+/H+ antiporter